MLALLLVALTAQAASRLQLTSDEVVVVLLGPDVMLSTGGTRHQAAHLAGGLYPIEVRTESGKVLYLGHVNLPEEGDVRATWSQAGGLVLSGAGASVAQGPGTLQPGVTRTAGAPDEAYVAPPEKPAKAIDNSGAGSRDRSAGSTESTTSAMPSGEVTQAVTNAVGLPSPQSPTVSAISTGGTAVGTFLGNAEAGTTFGNESKSYQPQSNPYAAPPVTGTVVLENPTGRAVDVFVDGMLLAQFKKDQVAAIPSKVGVGLVRIEWYDPASHTRIVGGMLKVEKNQRVGLVLGPEKVEARDRPWAWAPDP